MTTPDRRQDDARLAVLEVEIKHISASIKVIAELLNDSIKGSQADLQQVKDDLYDCKVRLNAIELVVKQHETIKAIVFKTVIGAIIMALLGLIIKTQG